MPTSVALTCMRMDFATCVRIESSLSEHSFIYRQGYYPKSAYDKGVLGVCGAKLSLHIVHAVC